MKFTISEADTEAHFRAIWAEALGIEFVPALFVDVTGCDDFVTGWIRIHGDWEGAVELQCHEAAAWLALNAMAPVDDAITSLDATTDIVAELTNMTAGGIRAMVDADCRVSIPEVRRGAASPFTAAAGFRAVAEFGFLCGGEPVFVRLLEHAAG